MFFDSTGLLNELGMLYHYDDTPLNLPENVARRTIHKRLNLLRRLKKPRRKTSISRQPSDNSRNLAEADCSVPATTAVPSAGAATYTSATGATYRRSVDVRCGHQLVKAKDGFVTLELRYLYAAKFGKCQ
jgi:hypothetical protein